MRCCIVNITEDGTVQVVPEHPVTLGWPPRTVVAVAPFALVEGENRRIAGVVVREDSRRHVHPCIPWIKRPRHI